MAGSDGRTHRPNIARLESLPLELKQRIMATLPAAERYEAVSWLALTVKLGLGHPAYSPGRLVDAGLGWH